jgi:Zn-dependent protease with chaperone function
VSDGAAFAADYYDGRDSARHRVEVVVRGASLLVRGADVLREHPVDAVSVQPRVGSLPVRVALPDGAMLLADADAVAAAMPVPRAAGLAHRLESHLGIVAACLAGIVVAGWFGYRDGVPWAARHLADHIPPALESQIAEEGMKNLDRVVLQPSKLAPQRQRELRAGFARLEAGLDPAARNAHLEFRDGGWIGANAFALPGGAVILTDQLAALLDDEHVLAVLAHELGHLHYRHGTRNILQDSIVGLGTMALFGDATAVSHVAAGLPTLLLHTGYSRDFEREADGFAFDLLKRTGRSPRLLGEALASLEKARDRPDAGSSECRVPGAPGKSEEPDERRSPRASELGYLSTHPATEERIRAAEAAAR